MSLDSFIRPSSIEALSLCPGRAAMEAAAAAAYPAPPSPPDAALGTLVHSLSESMLRDEAEPAECAGLNGWDRHCAKLYVDFVRELAVARGVLPRHIYVEQHLSGEWLGIPRGGTCDAILLIPGKRAIVVDLKSGMADQGEAKEHAQLACYAAMTAVTYCVDEVEVHLFAPRLEPALRHSSHLYDTAALAKVAKWVRSVTTAARSPDSVVVPSFTACQYCKALPHCAEAKGFIMQTKDALSLVGNATDPAAWGKMIEAGKIGGALDDAVKALAKPYLEAGGIADGFELQAGGMMTKIDTDQAFGLAAAAGQLPALVAFLSVKAEAAKALPCIAAACTKVPKSPSIKAIKR